MVGGLVDIRRDPFGRVTLVRETICPDVRGACRWCDGVGRFRYGWVSDGGSGGVTREAFCSVGCWESFNA